MWLPGETSYHGGPLYHKIYAQNGGREASQCFSEGYKCSIDGKPIIDRKICTDHICLRFTQYNTAVVLNACTFWVGVLLGLFWSFLQWASVIVLANVRTSPLLLYCIQQTLPNPITTIGCGSTRKQPEHPPTSERRRRQLSLQQRQLSLRGQQRQQRRRQPAQHRKLRRQHRKLRTKQAQAVVEPGLQAGALKRWVTCYYTSDTSTPRDPQNYYRRLSILHQAPLLCVRNKLSWTTAVHASNIWPWLTHWLRGSPASDE